MRKFTDLRYTVHVPFSEKQHYLIPPMYTYMYGTFIWYPQCTLYMVNFCKVTEYMFNGASCILRQNNIEMLNYSWWLIAHDYGTCILNLGTPKHESNQHKQLSKWPMWKQLHGDSMQNDLRINMTFTQALKATYCLQYCIHVHNNIEYWWLHLWVN